MLHNHVYCKIKEKCNIGRTEVYINLESIYTVKLLYRLKQVYIMYFLKDRHIESSKIITL
jgi:hypothetical protein